MTLCKVVYGCCAEGFKDVTGPMTHQECVAYLRRVWHEAEWSEAELAQAFGRPGADSHYEPSYDIINVESGRLASWVL